MIFTHCVGTYQGSELTRSSLGNARPQSSQLAEPSHGLLFCLYGTILLRMLSPTLLCI